MSHSLIHSSLYLPTHPSTHTLIHPSTHSPIHYPSIHPPTHSSTHPPIHLSIIHPVPHPPIHPLTHQHIHPSRHAEALWSFSQWPPSAKWLIHINSFYPHFPTLWGPFSPPEERDSDEYSIKEVREVKPRKYKWFSKRFGFWGTAAAVNQIRIIQKRCRLGKNDNGFEWRLAELSQ